MPNSQITILVIFFATLALTYAAAIYARWRSTSGSDEELAGRDLNKWLVGLSAGTTGNSGFIVTGAVGLGYAGGVHWVMLPLAWLLGDLVYWALFPDKLNDLARRAGATTLSEALTSDLSGHSARCLAVLVSVLLVVFLSGYTAAQWLAGEKFLSSAFGLGSGMSIAVFGATIVVYSGIGGFRGSVYTDFLQAIIRIVGTVVALAAVWYLAASNSGEFWSNIASAKEGFLQPFPAMSLISILGFMFGFAFAAIGFGLGQPQIITRYFAAKSPEEAKAARWIYIGFIQFTWVSMALFGVILRGVMPGIADPETGLIVFSMKSLWPIAAGIIFADIFATIASTSNGLLIAISQIVTRDLFARLGGTVLGRSLATMILGALTIGLSFVLPGSVYSIAIDAVSMIGAGLAGPVIVKCFAMRHSGLSLLIAFLSGLLAGVIWKFAGFGFVFNEAGVGLFVSLAVNFGVARISKIRARS